MQVSSGASWSTTTGMRQWSVTLDESDGAQLIEGFAELSWKDRLRRLQQSADILAVKYMFDEGAISQAFFEQRVREIKATKNQQG